MPRKTRPLWLKIKFDAPHTTGKTVIKKLLESIERGDYRYPREWRVAIGWSNKENGALKWGEFRNEMLASRQSSPGFDIAVSAYLENQL